MFLVAVLYLLVPAGIVLLTFSSWPMVALTAIGLAISAYSLRPAPDASGTPLWSSWPLLVVAAGMVWLSGALPPFPPNSDWIKHFALINAMRDLPWPPVLDVGQGPATLRYSLGWYAVPALVAKVLGKGFTGIAIFLWSTAGFFIALRMAFGALVRPSHLFAAGLIFVFFSGADILGTWITGHQMGPLLHLEWWAWFGELPSNTTSIFWTPQHAIPAWIGAMLFLRFPERSLGFGAAIAAAVAVWSPFALIGFIPIALWAVVTFGIRPVLSPVNLIGGPLLLIAAGVFLTTGAAKIPYGWIFWVPNFTWQRWLSFITLDLLLVVVTLLIAARTGWRVILPCALFVVALTLTYVGSANDLTMRGCLPAFGIIYVLATEAMLFRGYSRTLLIACFVAGLPTASGEIMRSLTVPRIVDPYDLSIQDAVGNSAHLALQYLVPVKP